MKRIVLICFGLLAAVCFCALPVHAEAVQTEIYEDSGADRLREALPEEARFLLDEAGVSPEPGRQGDALGFLSALADGVRESFTEPLRALVLLSQAPENSLQPLRPEETFPALAPHVFYPAWDAAGTALLMETLSACFAQAASFRLSCRPEEEAVALLRRAVWGEARA